MARSSGARSVRLGGVLGVVAACALAAVTAAGPPLYVSSAATAAVHVQAERSCAADLGARLLVPADAQRARERLAERIEPLDHLEAPVETWVLGGGYSVVGRDEDVRRSLVALHRPGQQDELGAAVPALADGDALLPQWAIDQLDLVVGDRLELSYQVGATRSGRSVQGDERILTLRVAGAYPALPVQPPSPYWCGLVSLFKPDAKGDFPPPVALVSAGTLAPLLAIDAAVATWEVRPDIDDVTRDEAADLAEGLGRVVRQYLDEEPALEGLPKRSIAAEPRLGALVGRSEQVADTVARTVGPVSLAGAVATAAVLVAAALLLGRARRRELRLLGVRGVPAAAVWARLARSLVVPVAGGVVLGYAAAVTAVAALGPAPQLEPRVVARAGLAAGAAGLVSLALLVGVAARWGSRLVDAPHGGRRRWLRRVPWEVGVVVLAAVSYRRLDRVGGVQLLGAQAYGGDVLAQAYPLLLLVACLAVLARPVVAVVRRLRFVGRRWRPAAQLGIRRVVAEPGVSVGLVLATALAVASLVSARVLTDSAVVALRDKAGTYVGSDLAIRSSGDDSVLPEAARARATTVSRVDVRVGSEGTAQVLGVDPATFGRAAAWRGDEASVSLDAVLARLSDPVPAGTLAAIVVGGRLTSGDLFGPAGSRVAVTEVAALDTFPGFHNPGPVLVVDRAALAATGMPGTFELWFRDPPADVVDQLRAADRRVYSVSGIDEVFDVSSFLAVRWSYALLGAFGVVIGVVTALAQLLVLDARRRSRQAAYVLTGRMGLGPPHQFTGLVVEAGVPVVLGTSLGVVIGVVAARTSVARLDTLRNLQPVARAAVGVGPVVAVVASAALVAVALAGWGLAGLVRTRPMEVLRETA